MNLKPLKDRVVIKMDEAEEKTSSGLFISSAAKEAPQSAVVIAVGPEIDRDEAMKGSLKVGDRVIVSKYAGTKVKLDEEELSILSYDDILAVLE